MRGIHFVEVKYQWLSTVKIHGLDTNLRPLENSTRFFVSAKAKKVIFHTIFLGVGGSIYTSHTLDHPKNLGLDTQKAHKTAFKLYTHSVLYAHKLTTTRRTLEKSCYSQGLGLEQGEACHPPDPH